MDPKESAAETATERESSKLMEATESMEESSAAVIASLSKRKSRSDPENEESGDEYVDSDDESGDEDEESDDEYVDSEDELKKRWPVPEWDVDSFDGLEYHSSEEENDFSDEEVERKLRRYKRLVIESKGFYVEPGLRPPFSFGGVTPILNLESSAAFGQTYRQYFEEMARLCLQKYNEENSEKNGFTVEFVEVVRGNYRGGPRSKSYITFKAKEKPDGPVVEYEAKVWCTFVQGENFPILCRPSGSANKPSIQDSN